MTDFFVIARMSRRDDEAISGCCFDDVLCWLGIMRLLRFAVALLAMTKEVVRLLPYRTLGDCFLSGRCAVATLAMTKEVVRLLPFRTLGDCFAALAMTKWGMRLLLCRTLRDCFATLAMTKWGMRSLLYRTLRDCFLTGRCAVAALAMTEIVGWVGGKKRQA